MSDSHPPRGRGQVQSPRDPRSMDRGHKTSRGGGAGTRESDISSYPPRDRGQA